MSSPASAMLHWREQGANGVVRNILSFLYCLKDTELPSPGKRVIFQMQIAFFTSYRQTSSPQVGSQMHPVWCFTQRRHVLGIGMNKPLLLVMTCTTLSQKPSKKNRLTLFLQSTFQLHNTLPCLLLKHIYTYWVTDTTYCNFLLFFTLVFESFCYSLSEEVICMSVW